ncbi:MAG: hypothetical protein ACI857_000631 [Arenicella sp.]|jgi:hypothetical protein
MKLLNLFAILLFLSFIFQSCGKIDASEGEISSEIFEVPDFNKIEIETAGVLNYTQSAERNVEVSTNAKILDLLDIKVEDNTLKISMTKNKLITNEESLVFTVSDDDVYSISTSGSAIVNANFDEGHSFEMIELISSGSGNIEQDAINASHANISTSGSGNINVQTVNLLNNMTVIQSGSGNVDIAGSADQFNLTISGSGSFSHHDFISQKVVAKLSGSGNANVSVSYDLNASLSGSGNLTFKGNPILKATSNSGSGQVIDGN